MKKILASLALLALTTSAHSAGFFPTVLSGNTTIAPNSSFLGAPDDVYLGIGGQVVTYDFGLYSVDNRSGVDFNVYEVDTGSPEFTAMEVLVSNDGTTFTSVKSSEILLINANRISGDSVHNNNNFGRSYDLGSFASVRYIRIDGVGTGVSGGSTAFDLDAIGAHQVTAVPEPESYAMLMAGLGLLGFTARRMKRETSA